MYSDDHLMSIRNEELEPEVRQTIDNILSDRGVTKEQIAADLTRKPSSKWKYIGAWILWGWFGNILAIPLAAFAEEYASGIQSMNE